MADEKKEPTRGHTTFLNELLEQGFNSDAIAVMMALLRYYNKEKGYSYPSQPLLMDRAGIKTKPTLKKTLKMLEDGGYITREYINGKGYRYYLHLGVYKNEPGIKTNRVQNNTGYKNEYTEGSKSYPQGGQNHTPTNTNINTNTITNNNMSDSKESDAPPGAFKGDNNNSNKTNENTITTKSKGEKEKEKNSAKKKEKEQQIKEVVEYLNIKANRNYRPGTTKTKSLISARLKDYTVEDLKAVIDFKVGEWLENEKMNKYLRPETLFNETKFENYINELPSQATKKSSQSYLEDNDVELSLDDIIKINLGKTNKE